MSGKLENCFRRRTSYYILKKDYREKLFYFIPRCLPPVCDSVSVSGASSSPGVFAAAGHSASRGAGGGRALSLSPLPPASTVVLTVRGVPAHVHSSHWVKWGDVE